MHGPAQPLGGQVGQHLVHVHVGRRPRTGLEDVDGELVAPSPLDHFAGGLGDGFRHVLVDDAEPAVLDGGRPLDERQGPDEAGGDRLPGPGSDQPGHGDETEPARLPAWDRLGEQPEGEPPAVGDGEDGAPAVRPPLDLVDTRPHRGLVLVGIEEDLTARRRQSQGSGLVIADAPAARHPVHEVPPLAPDGFQHRAHPGPILREARAHAGGHP